ARNRHEIDRAFPRPGRGPGAAGRRLPGHRRTRARRAAGPDRPGQCPVQGHRDQALRSALGDDLPARWPPAGHRDGWNPAPVRSGQRQAGHGRRRAEGGAWRPGRSVRRGAASGLCRQPAGLHQLQRGRRRRHRGCGGGAGEAGARPGRRRPARGLRVIWRQEPKVSGQGHFGQRIAFDRDGKLWISSSERQKFDPAQDMKANLGKMIRLNDDGSVPSDNPFVDQGGVAAQVWSLGHRNILGVAFDGEGRLWAHEMGPKGGDELNLIERGANYGYPIVSNGDHYDGKPIPDHDTRPEFHAPAVSWNPVISPAGFVIYSGDRYPVWTGSGLIGGLSSKSLVRIAFDGTHAREAERYDMGRRIREVEQGPDGTVWLLEDGTRDGQGWLLRLDPKS